MRTAPVTTIGDSKLRFAPRLISASFGRGTRRRSLKPPLAFAPPRDRGATSGARADTTSLSLIVETLSRRTQAAFFKAGYVPNLASQD